MKSSEDLPASASVTKLRVQHICLPVMVTSIFFSLKEFHLKLTIQDVFMNQWTMKQAWPRFTQSERLEHRGFMFPISCLMQ